MWKSCWGLRPAPDDEYDDEEEQAEEEEEPSAPATKKTPAKKRGPAAKKTSAKKRGPAAKKTPAAKKGKAATAVLKSRLSKVQAFRKMDISSWGNHPHHRLRSTSSARTRIQPAVIGGR